MADLLQQQASPNSYYLTGAMIAQLGWQLGYMIDNLGIVWSLAG
jgi:hypothetical protein